MRNCMLLILATAILASCSGGGGATPSTTFGAVGGATTPAPMPTPSQSAISIVEYALAKGDSGPAAITLGPDGNLWFTEANKIGRITVNGTITDFPAAQSSGGGIAAGSDGNLWFVANAAIGKITTGGTVTEFPLPSPSPDTFYVQGGIAAGADGKIWFNFRQCNSYRIGGIFRVCNPVLIDKISPTGAISGFRLAGSVFCSAVGQLTAGPDGNVWFTDPCANKIGRITTGGVISEFTIPGPSVGVIGGIVAGPDHNLWFIAPKGSALVDATLKVDRVTTSGVISEYAIRAPALGANGTYCGDSIAGGPDGNLWFTECAANKIGVITPAGTVAQYPIPTANSGVAGITAGLGSTVWFTESGAGKIGKFKL